MFICVERCIGYTSIKFTNDRPLVSGREEAPITVFMTLHPTGMYSVTGRLLAGAVGQKHSEVAHLRLAPEPTAAFALHQIEAMNAAEAVSKTRPPCPGASGTYDNAVKKRRQSYGGLE